MSLVVLFDDRLPVWPLHYSSVSIVMAVNVVILIALLAMRVDVELHESNA